MTKLLIVEDNEGVGNLYKEIFPDADLARTGDCAAMLALTGDYDLVIMDLALPHIDGVLIALALRGLGFVGPILMITGNMHPMNEILARKARVEAIVEKPVLPRELEELVAKHARKAPDTGTA
jgi:DNA-binding response OmpR family regulator